MEVLLVEDQLDIAENIADFAEARGVAAGACDGWSECPTAAGSPVI